MGAGGAARALIIMGRWLQVPSFICGWVSSFVGERFPFSGVVNLFFISVLPRVAGTGFDSRALLWVVW